jgi:hypothetical protein
MIICRDEDTCGNTATYFSSLHNLLLSRPGQAALCSLVSVNFDLPNHFRNLHEGSYLFHLALIREGRRATGHRLRRGYLVPPAVYLRWMKPLSIKPWK